MKTVIQLKEKEIQSLEKVIQCKLLLPLYALRYVEVALLSASQNRENVQVYYTV